VPRIVIILAHGSALEQAEGLLASLAEPTEPSLSVELLLIGTPKDRREREGKVATLKLDERRRVGLSVVEALSDKSSDLIDAVSKGLQLAAQAKRDAIVVSARSSFGCDAILELLAVGDGDPLLGFVEAAVSDEDDPAAESGAARPESGHEGALILEGMPRSSYVPIVEGPLVLIKSLMLQEFRLLDGGFNNLAAALSDFALRANRCGYRVARANYARATTRKRGKADRLSDKRDLEILRARFPYLAEEIARGEASADARTRKLLAGLRRDSRDRLNIVFACNNVGTVHNGTSELAKRIIREFSSSYSNEYNIHVLCSSDAFAFHGYGELNGVVHLRDPPDEAEKPFFASIRLVQPFRDEDIVLLTDKAPVTMVLMLDTIAIDCMQIDPRLAGVWERMLKSISALGFISDFSRAQFNRRLRHESAHLGFTALCSTDTEEYGVDKSAAAPRDDGYVLLVGNSYEHKFLKASCDIFRRETPETKLVVLGLKLTDDDQVSSYESGQLDDDAVADLFAGASLVFFPSHCEGFGLPIMHGLARRKPVVARDLPVFREIQERVREARNLHLFETTLEMVRFAATKPAWDPKEIEPPHPVQNWASMAKAMHDALVEAGERVNYRSLHDRLFEAAACREIARLETLAASRLAQIKELVDPPIEQAQMSAQAARFAAKHLEAGIRRFLDRRWAYSLTRFTWGIVKTLRK
jgi:Glycosyl transferases group 1